MHQVVMLMHMRTTMNLPDALLAAAKDRAARDGRTVTSLVEEGLREILARDPIQKQAVQLPTDGLPNGRFLIDIGDADAISAELDADGLK